MSDVFIVGILVFYGIYNCPVAESKYHRIVGVQVLHGIHSTNTE